jgi:hypothetical protein
MSDEHKEALAEGRNQSRAVRNYLEALQTHRPKRGRRRTGESIARRLEKIEEELASADPIKQLNLVQERIDLTVELATVDNKVDLSELEAAFIESAKGYAQRKGISYAAFRELGVSAQTLKAAGISRSGS